jgi:glycine/serine hydroxymethyltransferase
MTVALAGLTQPGDTIMSVAPDDGGHVSTRVVAERLGLNVVHLPMVNVHDIDLECLCKTLKQKTFQLVYLDQSVFLYPIDTMAVREVIDCVSPCTLLHYDSSHVNGLIFGKVLPNPLASGATSFGGSTHKTFPGPHKAFLATNDEQIAKRFQTATDHFVSHHHMADVLSLTIALIEFRNCGGEKYAGLCIENARRFAKTLATRGLRVGGRADNPTGCHQVWVEVPENNDVASLVNRLKSVGIIANNFGRLPGIPRPAFRLSSAELTRRGAEEIDILEIADVFSEILLNKGSDNAVVTRVQQLRNKLVRPRFCFGQEAFLEFGISPKAAEFLGSMVGEGLIFSRV